MSTAQAATSDASDRPADAAPVAKLAQRDGAIALGALSLFAAADAWLAVTGSSFAGLLAVADGIVVGVVLGTLAHEWGHFAGARWSGGVAPTRSLKSRLPIFDFDLARSESGSFLAMSVGGNVAHWALVVALAALLPFDGPGRIALVAAAFGFAVSASLTEVPIIWRHLGGASAAESFRGLSKQTIQRDRWIGAGAGVGLFLAL
jgi:hypothetical protein